MGGCEMTSESFPKHKGMCAKHCKLYLICIDAFENNGKAYIKALNKLKDQGVNFH